MTRTIVGPFNRVEGDLEVQLDIRDGHVAEAWVNSPLYRGFEEILQGRPPTDAIVIAPRVCGICSVSQSVAAISALADWTGIKPAPNGEAAINVLHAAENLADHVTHFYLFFMPDFAREVYRTKSWFEDTQTRFAAMKGTGQAAFLPARARLMHIQGILAGKWPHSLALQPGGTTKGVSKGERTQLMGIVAGFRRFLEETLFGDRLEAIAALDSARALDDWRASGAGQGSDFHRFLTLADDLSLATLGRTDGRFMSYGAYETDGARLFPSGTWEGGAAPLDVGTITEDATHAWLAGGVHPPAEGLTRIDMDKAGGYTWCKAPRLDGRTVEVGALARQMVAGHPLIRDLVATTGSNVQNRIIARMVECARLIPAMESWLKAIDPGGPFCTHTPAPSDGSGVGLVEAARGSLGHWLQVKDGHIRNYQIIAPTTWNFSPRDEAGVPGPLESALVGTPAEENVKDPVAVQHVVRSFDPCMVCTVH